MFVKVTVPQSTCEIYCAILSAQDRDHLSKRYTHLKNLLLFVKWKKVLTDRVSGRDCVIEVANER